jgi:tRNA (guanine37-N1)-methyltransferase
VTPAPSIRFDILTIFPGMFTGPLDQSILSRARDEGLIDVHIHDLRDWTHDRHRTVDDYPFGGGAGMLMKPEPIFEALEAIRPLADPEPYVIFMSPQGHPLDRALVDQLAEHPRLLLLCGRYEGVDERVLQHAVDLEVSVGDFVVSGGELPAMMLLDAVARRVHGVLGGEASLDEESFEGALLEYSQYTRPAEFRGWAVPDILLSGHHAEIALWRRRERLLRTRDRRPDLLEQAQLTAKERAWLAEQADEVADPGFAQREVDGVIFQARVAVVATSRGRILLHRTAGEAIWSLPGGRLRVGESVADAARRELQEEAGFRVRPGEILWVIENFFEFHSAFDGPGQGRPATHHEIGIYVEATVPPRFEEQATFTGTELAGTAREFALEFRWFEASELDAIDLRPAVLRPRLDALLETRR